MVSAGRLSTPFSAGVQFREGRQEVLKPREPRCFLVLAPATRSACGVPPVLCTSLFEPARSDGDLVVAESVISKGCAQAITYN